MNNLMKMAIEESRERWEMPVKPNREFFPGDVVRFARPFGEMTDSEKEMIGTIWQIVEYAPEYDPDRAQSGWFSCKVRPLTVSSEWILANEPWAFDELDEFGWLVKSTESFDLVARALDAPTERQAVEGLCAKVDRLESRVADLKASKRAQKRMLKRALVQIQDLQDKLHGGAR